MRQRYFIFKEGVADNLVIEEYAVVSEAVRQKDGIQPLEDDYTLLYQEKHNGDRIKASIFKGVGDVIAMLRTENLFPVRSLAEEIAASVIDLYGSSEKRSAELFFNDSDQFGLN